MRFIKKIIIRLLSVSLLKPFLKSKIFIFCFHDISDISEDHHSEYYSTEKNIFLKQLNFIIKNFEIISIEQLKTKHLLDNKKAYAVLTFDDGFYSVLSEAHPMLSKKNIPYTLFLNQSAIEKNQLWCSNVAIHKNDVDYLNAFYNNLFIDKTAANYSAFINNKILPVDNLNYDKLEYNENKTKDKIYATKDDLKAVLKQSSLITIGNHTSNHYNLAKCSKTLQEKEIADNHQYVKDVFGITMEHFAIPFGKKQHFNEDTLSALAKYNYPFVYSTNPSYITTDKKSDAQVFPRIGITNQTVGEIKFYINRTLFKSINL